MPLSLRAAINAIHDVLLGVGTINRNGFVHLDLKPSNVLKGDDGRYLVADFGLATRLNRMGHADAPGMYFATLPPEMTDDTTATTLADIYLTGFTFYRTLNGDQWYKEQENRYDLRTPEGQNALRLAIARGRFPNRSAFLPHVPDTVRRIVRKAMRPEPERRYQSAEAFALALSRVALTHDWQVAERDGGLVWTSIRPGSATIEVASAESGGCYSVEAHKITQGGQRRRCTEVCGRTFQTRAEAFKYLEDQVFKTTFGQG